MLDLPQLYARPSSDVLICVLESLALTTPPWSWIPHDDDEVGGDAGATSTASEVARCLRESPGLTSYLTGIVANSLSWVADEATRERIWHLASTRLSERCGRMGMLT